MARGNYIWAALAVSGVCFSIVGTVSASGDLRTVAITGQSAPGVEAGLTFNAFSFFDAAPPVINDVGEVAFSGRLVGTGSFLNDSGIWSEGGGSGLALVARDGSTAPGTTVPFSDFNDAQPVINNRGETAFGASLDTSNPGVTSLNFRGVWSEGHGSGLALVARGSDPAPGTSLVFDSGYIDPLFNDSGHVAFESLMSAPGSPAFPSHGIWSEGGGSGLALVTRGGNHAPGAAAGVNFATFDNVLMNDSGGVAFRATLLGPGVTVASDDGIWRNASGGIQLVAREGDPIPGAGAGVRFGIFASNDALGLNIHGRTAFRGTQQGPGISSGNALAIWKQVDGGALEKVAEGGEQAPGAAAGALFDFGVFRPALPFNDQDHVAFIADFYGTETGVGIWSEGRGNGLELVAKSGTRAPGAEPGVSFGAFVHNTLVLNDAGQTAFWANLTGPGIDLSNDSCIWAQDLAGNLRLIAREGSQLDVSDDPLAPDFRTISVLSWIVGNTGNSDGRASSFNDRGQLTFVARFTDGTEGVFVSNLVAVPEPHLVTVLSALAFAATHVCRRRIRCG